jgi:hypothetical protein
MAKDPLSEVAKNPISLLPDGSVLHGVHLPRYDKDQNLVGDLKAEIMTLINPQQIQGENVLIKFYNPDRSLRGKVQFQKAVFNQTTSKLRADEAVEITTDKLVARGSGLIYSFQNGQGFLIGPATTWISYSEPTTSMRPSPIKTAAVLALCLTPALSVAEISSGNVSNTELQTIQSAAASAKNQLDTDATAIDAALKEDLEASKVVSDAVQNFLKTDAPIQPANPSAQKPVAPADAAPLEVNPGPNDTVITCDGGMYFDADAGVLVYLENVTVSDPRFTLTGADELKIFFEKKAPKKTADPDKEKKPEKAEDLTKTEKQPKAIGPGANFGEVQKLIATGTVRLVQKSVGGKAPVEASGGLLTYDVPKGEIIISQRYPWVKQGSFYARAKQPNLTLRLLNNGSFSTQGNWEMGGSNLNNKGR